jgi:hypothetical protein
MKHGTIDKFSIIIIKGIEYIIFRFMSKFTNFCINYDIFIDSWTTIYKIFAEKRNVRVRKPFSIFI